MQDVTFTVLDREVGERLDKLVVRHVGGIGRRRASELFANGRVEVDGTPASKGEPARVGSSVVVKLQAACPVPVEPDAPLAVCLENEHYVVVRKPAGQATAPLRGESGTLAGALLSRYPEMAFVGYSPREPGILHRLDTGTSGLLLAARTGKTFEALRRALTQSAIEKHYLAIVSRTDLPESGVIAAFVGPDTRRARRVAVYDCDPPPSARAQETRYRVVRVGARRSLLEVRVSRAYRHQIRAHLAHVRAPIVGDALYGSEDLIDLPDRHALHASYVAWAGDETLPAFSVADDLPQDLSPLLD
jgi:23S rRNA pseudouridine1911/1915/1917 synthase